MKVNTMRGLKSFCERCSPHSPHAYYAHDAAHCRYRIVIVRLCYTYAQRCRVIVPDFFAHTYYYAHALFIDILNLAGCARCLAGFFFYPALL